MMAAVPHVTSGSGFTKFQADGFLFDRVYNNYWRRNDQCLHDRLAEKCFQ